jgi:tryptophan synthase alpha chain
MGRLGIYLVAGYPSKSEFLDGVRACEETGVDFLEVGFPFSDPVADGDVIERAAQASLARCSADDLFAAVQQARGIFSRKLYVMTYANIVYRNGASRFMDRARSIDGLIVADLPLREMALFEERVKGNKINLIRFVTPESRAEDIASTLKSAKDFVYFVSKRGTTGGAFHLDGETRKRIAQVRGNGVDVYIGFGIRNRKDVLSAYEAADGAIIGTEAVHELENGLDRFRNFLRSVMG